MEIILAGLALFLLAPLPAFFAIAIKLDSRGPVIFRQPRIGRRGCRSHGTCSGAGYFSVVPGRRADIFSDLEPPKRTYRVLRTPLGHQEARDVGRSNLGTR